jgi:hypothetical protein
MLNSSTYDAKKFASRTGKKWVDSKLIDYCAECDQKFTMINRKHHCRQCGEVICNKCSPDRVLIGDSATPSRICRSCYTEHQKFTSLSQPTREATTGSVNRDTSPEPIRYSAGDFHGRYEKIQSCYTSNKYHYGPAPSQYFLLHIPREVLLASAASNSSKEPKKSVPIVVLIHGGFWKVKYGIDNSSIDSLVPFLLSKGMAVCQIEYRRVGNHSKEYCDLLSQQGNVNRHPPPPSVSPTFLQQYPPGHLMYMHVSHQYPAAEDSWERTLQHQQQHHQQQQQQSAEDVYTMSSSSRGRDGSRTPPSRGPNRSLSPPRPEPPDDEGGFPHTNEDILQALRLLHHKCRQMNTNASGVDSFTHHHISANRSRCISRLAKMDTSRIVLLGHSAGGYLALWACCRLQQRKIPFQPLLCVAVAPVCNLSEADSQG